MFLDRQSSKDKKAVQDKIIKRQALAETDPDIEPLIIFPEGGTTNGQQMIQFKRGAFVGLRSIWPKVHKIWSPFQTPFAGAIGGFPYFFIACSILWSSCTKYELPIFRPNDYFFEHHQKEGEQKHDTYARVVRQLMSEASGLQVSDQSVEDKFEYIKILYPNDKKHL